MHIFETPRHQSKKIAGYSKKMLSHHLLGETIMNAKDGQKILIPSVNGTTRIVTVEVKEQPND